MDHFSDRMIRHHFLSREERNIHTRWNRDIPPVLNIKSGDLLSMETRDASDGAFTPDSTAADIAARDTGRIHPLTGPVFVEGAGPGDVLKVDILEYELGDWGWSVSGPGKGLLPELLERDYFKAWRYDKKSGYAWFNEYVRVKLAPFCGVLGTAPAERGEFRTGPPGKHGGNMDIRYLTAGYEPLPAGLGRRGPLFRRGRPCRPGGRGGGNLRHRDGAYSNFTDIRFTRRIH